MNKASCVAILLGLGSVFSYGQNNEYAHIVGQGPHYNRWERIIPATNRFDGALFTTNYYVELQTGLNHLVGENYAPSSEEIVITDDGAVATNGQHQVFFDGQINTDGAVQIVTADGKRLSTRVLGLSYFDTATGNSVLIAELKDSIGVILPTKNQVLYKDCFDGVTASLRYTYTKAGLEQDVLIDQQLPSPLDWGLDPQTTQLEVLTEFLNAVNPSINVQGEGTSSDEALDFGAMRMGRGKAFFAGKESMPIQVRKHWRTLEGRTFLIEQVEYPAIEPELQSLPAAPAITPETAPSDQGSITPIKNRVSQKRVLPPRRQAKNSSTKFKMASISSPTKEFVLDYDVLNSSTNFCFVGDSTYSVTGPVVLSGTNTVIEGGTVVKFSAGGSLTFSGPVTCLTTNYRPAVFTCKDDESVGETISGATGSPSGYYATVALNFNTGGNIALRNLRVGYAQTAIALNSPGGTLTDIQVYNCQSGIAGTNATYSLRNALFYNVLTNFSGTGSTGRITHLTSDTGNQLLSGGVNLLMTNSLLVGVPNVGSFTSNTVRVVASRTGVFQETGTGGRYLVTGSPYRNLGITSIDADLLASLRTKTTYAPIVYSNITFTTPQSFGPIMPRDTNALLDLGYHYEPLDYVFGGVTANSSVTVNAGTAIGWFRTTFGWLNAGYGIHMADYQTLAFNGTVTSPVSWVRCHTVQEWDHNRGYGPGGVEGSGATISSAPVFNAQFTRFSMLEWQSTGGHLRDDNGFFTVNMQNCEIYGGITGGYWLSLNARNCLFFRTDLGVSQGYIGTYYNLTNCTIIGNVFNIARTCSSSVNVANCAFDGTSISMQDSYTNYSYCDYNAFLQGASRTAPTGAHDVIVTNSFNWQVGPLGRWYELSNSSLINKGSTNANYLGLYHFTTQTNQAKETTSVVDIGYHYVAVDANGNPIDTDGDGIPDYLEDANGNGLVDSGETNWTDANDLGLNVIITEPKNNSIIP